MKLILIFKYNIRILEQVKWVRLPPVISTEVNPRDLELLKEVRKSTTIRKRYPSLPHDQADTEWAEQEFRGFMGTRGRPQRVPLCPQTPSLIKLIYVLLMSQHAQDGVSVEKRKREEAEEHEKK